MLIPQSVALGCHQSKLKVHWWKAIAVRSWIVRTVQSGSVLMCREWRCLGAQTVKNKGGCLKCKCRLWTCQWCPEHEIRRSHLHCQSQTSEEPCSQPKEWERSLCREFLEFNLSRVQFLFCCMQSSDQERAVQGEPEQTQRKMERVPDPTDQVVGAGRNRVWRPKRRPSRRRRPHPDWNWNRKRKTDLEEDKLCDRPQKVQGAGMAPKTM